MSDIVNDRDVLLQAAGQRTTPATDRALLLAASSNLVKVPGSGSPSPATITLVATPLNMTGSVTFTTSPVTPLTVSGNTATLAATDIAGQTVEVTASITKDGIPYTAKQTIARVADGAFKGLVLTASSQVFQVSKAGAGAPGSITLTATANGLSGTPSWTIPAGTATLSGGANAWQKVLNFPNFSGDTVRIRVEQDGLFDEVTIARLREGSDAVNALLTNESANVAATSAGGVVGSEFSVAGGTFRIYDGVTDKTGSAEVTYSVASEVGVDVSIASTGVYTVNSMSADTGTATLRAVYKGLTLDKVYTIVKAKAGAPGASAKSLMVTATSQVFLIAKSGAVAPSSISLKAIAQNLTGTPVWTVPSGNGILTAGADDWSKTLNYSGMGADAVTFYVTQDGLTDQITIVRVREGTDAMTGILTNESANVPADSSGTVSSYANANGTFQLYDGSSNVTGHPGITYSVYSQTGISAFIGSNGVYGINAMSADSGSAVLRAVYRGVTIDKTLTVVKAKAGAAGVGSPGAAGNSYVIAYCASSTPTASSAPSPTTGADSVPAANSGGITGTWSKTPPTLSAGQFQFQSDGVYNPATNQVTWNKPYWSSLKVANLSAITADLGTVTAGSYSTATTGQRVTINESSNNQLKAYNSSGVNVATIGGTVGGHVYAESSSSALYAVYGKNTANGPTVVGFNTYNVEGSGALPTNCGGWFSSVKGSAIIADSTSGNAITINNGANGIVQTGGSGGNYLRGMHPATDNGYSLGFSGTFRWSAVYATSSTITTSDARSKKNISDSTLGLAFIMSLRPVGYQQIVGENVVTDNWVETEPEVTTVDDFGNLVIITPAVVENQPIVTPRPGMRRHFGLLAQEVKASLDAHGEPDAAIWSRADRDDPDSLQALRYEELIGPLIKAVQELRAMVAAQGSEIQQLKGANA